MRAILVAALLWPILAQAGTDAFGTAYTCTGSGPVTCARGGLTISAPSEAVALNTFNGMAPPGWVAPAPPAPTTLSALDFLKRFTSAERATIRGTPALADWVSLATAAITIDVTDPILLQGMSAAVSAGVITSQRSAQILNLSASSP